MAAKSKFGKPQPADWFRQLPGLVSFGDRFDADGQGVILRQKIWYERPMRGGESDSVWRQ